MKTTEHSNSYTDILIDDLCEILDNPFPVSAIYHAKNRLLDYIGVTFAGVKILHEKGISLLNILDKGSGFATVIGHNTKSSFLNAILLNGLNSHVAELDDGERFAMMHPGSPIISALLPIIEERKMNGQDLIRGIIIGYEATIRIARSLQPALKDRGFHATGIAGTIGAAVAIGAALNYSKAEMKNAISAAATSAAGLLEVIDDGSQLKPYNSAHAALSGTIASIVAKSNFIGPNDVLGGKRGLFNVLTDNYDLSKLRSNTNDLLRVENCYVKPYAACRHCHPAIESALNLLDSERLTHKDIDKINVYTYYWAVKGHDHKNINGVSSAKMSTPYSVAVAIIKGKAGIYEFMPEVIQDSEIVKLTNKVTVLSDDDLTNLFPQKRAAIVEFLKKDGTIVRNRVDIPKGEPENPLSDEELKDKFIELSLYGNKNMSEINEIFQIVMDIENRIDNLYPLL